MSALHNSFLSSETPIRVPNGNTSIGRSRRADSRSSTTTRPGRAPLSRAARRDWKLVQQAVAGDSRAREELFTIHTARLYRTAFSVLRNKDDAQDAVQNGLCSAFLNLGSFKGQSLFSTWLTRIVINSALMIRRSRTGHVETSLDDMMDSQPERLRHRIVHTAPNPEEAYAVKQTNELVSEQIRKLPPTLRAPLQLCSIRGLSTADACQVLGIGHGALKGRIFRARHKLAYALQPTMRHRQAEKTLE